MSHSKIFGIALFGISFWQRSFRGSGLISVLGYAFGLIRLEGNIQILFVILNLLNPLIDLVNFARNVLVILKLIIFPNRSLLNLRPSILTDRSRRLRIRLSVLLFEFLNLIVHDNTLLMIRNRRSLVNFKRLLLHLFTKSSLSQLRTKLHQRRTLNLTLTNLGTAFIRC